jgi:hypothetical protein
LPILAFQFGNPQVQPLDLFQRKQVNLSEKLDDFRLG